jgi:hypothetical protein
MKENQKLREALAMARFHLSTETKAKQELADLLGQFSARVAASLSELVNCKQEISRLTTVNASLVQVCSRQLIGICKLRNLLQQHEGSPVVPEAGPTTPAAADNASEPSTPARQLFSMFVGAAEPSPEFDVSNSSSSSSSSSPASPSQSEPQGSVSASPTMMCNNSSPGSIAASPLQRSHSLADIPSRSLP